jgi:hypothetical protein
LKKAQKVSASVIRQAQHCGPQTRKQFWSAKSELDLTR